MYIFFWNWKNVDEPDDVFSQGVFLPSLFLRALFELACTTPVFEAGKLCKTQMALSKNTKMSVQNMLGFFLKESIFALFFYQLFNYFF